MSRDLRIRGNDYAGRSHNEPGARCELNVIQLAGRDPLRSRHTVAWSRGKEGHALIDLRRASWFCSFPQELRLLPGSEVSGRRNDLAPIYRASMQTGNNLSPGLFASVVAGSHGGDNDLASFTSRAALKFANFAQAVADITALLFIGIFATLYFLSPFIALACFIIARLK